MRAITLALVSSACAAAVTFTNAVERLPLTRPEPPLNAQDTIVALAIREAVMRGIPGFEPRREVVVQRVPGLVTSRTLPQIDSVAFFLLDTFQIRTLADQAGEFMYLRPTPPRIDGDTAVVGLGSELGLKHRTHVRAIFGVGGCSWRAVRRSTTWVVDSTLGCIIS